MEIDHADPEVLTFTSLPARSHDPAAHRRAKLVANLEDQKRLLADPSYVRVVQRWTGKGDQRKQIEKQQRVRPWWRADAAGQVVMSVYHGTQPVEFEKGKAAIAVQSKDKLGALIDNLIGGREGGRARRAAGAREQAGRRGEAPTRGVASAT